VPQPRSRHLPARARYVAENFDTLPKPYRSYRHGYVYRNEKPGPGRFRQFMQFDADTVGAAGMAADAEICMMAADTMEALGVPRGSYVVKVHHRNVLDGILASIGINDDKTKLTVLRAIDKRDRLGDAGVRALLGAGREDESGDFTRGAGLPDTDIDKIVEFVAAGIGDKDDLSDRIKKALGAAQLGRAAVRDLLAEDSAHGPSLSQGQIEELFGYLHLFPGFEQPHSKRRREVWGDDLILNLKFSDDAYRLRIDNFITVQKLKSAGPQNETYLKGVAELEEIATIAEASTYGSGRILLEPSVVRGLEYYTGPVYEVELTFPVEGDDGKPVRFGSVAGGGRYDGLVARFRGEPVPATGFSIGVSRLMAALAHLGKIETKPEPGPVVVTVFDRDRIADYQRMVSALRAAGIRAEMYLGSGKFGPQMKYADRRNAPCVVIQGGDEKAKGEVQIKDLILGAAITAIKDRDEYLKKQAEVQMAITEDRLIDAVREVLSRHGIRWS
jgi:histidyl-tRNA synthetase